MTLEQDKRPSVEEAMALYERMKAAIAASGLGPQEWLLENRLDYAPFVLWFKDERPTFVVDRRTYEIGLAFIEGRPDPRLP